MTHRKQNGLAAATALARRWRFAMVAALILVPCWAGADNVPELSGDGASELPRQALSEPVLGSLRTALGAYEATRSDLAGDQLAVLPASASALAGALRMTLEDQTELTSQVSGVIEDAARAAESLAQVGDLVAARETFGEVSRLLMVLATGDPRLTEGWHVFACPMVETFAKWLQPTEELENPYMGPSMPKCGFASDWSLPARSSAEALASNRRAGAKAVSSPEPVFEPGISGLKMVDVRDHKFLWREIDELQIWERGGRITVREYRSKAIEKTAHFLELDSASADEFIATASEVVDGVRQSFRNRQVKAGTSGVGGQFSSDLGVAVTRLTSLLQEKEPRHQLFTPGCKKWLLKLAFGPTERKETRESQAG